MSQIDRGRRHIALYIGSLNMGGAERVMVNLAEALFFRGYRVTFVTTYIAGEEYEVPHGCWRVLKENDVCSSVVHALDTDECSIRVGFDTGDVNLSAGIAGISGNSKYIGRVFSGVATSNSGGRVAGFLRRIKVLKSIWSALKPDVILSFLGKNNLMALLSAGRATPVAVSVRALPELEYPGFFMRNAAFLLFCKAAGVALQTQDAAGFFPERIRKKASILQNAVSEDFLTPRFRGEREKNIVSVGRLDENKNTAMLIRAFAALKKEGGGDSDIGEYRLVIYGDGEERERLEALTGEMKLEASVQFAGRTNNIAEKIWKAGIFVLCSDTEGMPNTLIEAMCLGLACVSTDCPCGGPAELIEDGINGLLIPVGDEGALKEALKRLISDRKLADLLGENATALQERFNSDAVMDKWEEFLTGCIGD